MPSSQFQALINTLKSGNISKFVSLVKKLTEHYPSYITDSKDYDKFKTSLKKTYYDTLSKCLYYMRFDDFSQLFNNSDRIGIFIDVANLDVVKIISKLHVDGIKMGDTGRIIELIRFFNEYNLFERKLSADELKIVQEIKNSDKLLIYTLKDLFGKVTDSLIYYVCKIMPHDYVVWLRDRDFIVDPNFLKNWTDNFSIYGLSVRNLGRVEDFIKKVETTQNSGNLDNGFLTLRFNPRYIINYESQRILREYHEIHLVYPENIKKNKEKILDKNNYNFYSLSMVIFGGLGPEGFGFTYSTPKGEVIEICSDQRETEAIIIKFKQYLKRKFLDKLEKEMESLKINIDIRRKVIQYLSDIINPKELISYNDKNSILRKIRDFLFQFDEIQKIKKSELEDILLNISIAISVILKSVKMKDQFMTRMELVANNKLKSEDLAKLTSLKGKSHYDVLRERIFLQNKPKWFFKDYPEEIKEFEDEYYKLAGRRWRW
ncbi:MAG: hypothetical protein ACFFC3_06380 [Candidatus Odinarchaeota archaeon]